MQVYCLFVYLIPMYPIPYLDSAGLTKILETQRGPIVDLQTRIQSGLNVLKEHSDLTNCYLRPVHFRGCHILIGMDRIQFLVVKHPKLLLGKGENKHHVWLGINPITGGLGAVSSPRKNPDEVTTLYQFGYLITSYYRIPRTRMVTRFFSEGNLHENRKHLRQDCEKMIRIARGLMSEVFRFHALGFVLRDLKAQNVLLNKDEEVGILDHDLIDRNTNPDIIRGCPIAWPPEVYYVWKGGEEPFSLGPEVDIYALGVLLYKLDSKREKGFVLPWLKNDWLDLWMQTDEGSLNARKVYRRLWEKREFGKHEYLAWLTHPDPWQRPTIVEAIGRFDEFVASKKRVE